jgi:hypothetical protein
LIKYGIFLKDLAYSLPSERLDITAQSAAMSNSWVLMSIFIVGREYDLAYLANKLDAW